MLNSVDFPPPTHGYDIDDADWKGCTTSTSAIT